MTLIVNEIYIKSSLQDSFIVFTADRIVLRNEKFDSVRTKLFKIPYLNAGISYFGLAELKSNYYLSDWLKSFISHNSQLKTMENFAEKLCVELNTSVDKPLLRKYASGFHLCGYNNNNEPQFWFIRNIEAMADYKYRGFKDYYSISEDFLSRDVNHIKLDSNDYAIQFYVNGDIRPFHKLWYDLENFTLEMRQHKDFKSIRLAQDYEEIAKWKMKIVCSFYKSFANIKGIGGPVTSFVLTPK